MPETEPPPRSTGGPLAFVAFAVVFVVLVGGYFLWLARKFTRVDRAQDGGAP